MHGQMVGRLDGIGVVRIGQMSGVWRYVVSFWLSPVNFEFEFCLSR